MRFVIDIHLPISNSAVGPRANRTEDGFFWPLEGISCFLHRPLSPWGLNTIVGGGLLFLLFLFYFFVFK